MPSISVIHATVEETVETIGTTFAEVVESDALTDGTTYHVVCHAIIGSDSSSLTFEWRLVDRTNSDTVLPNSTLIRELASATSSQSYYFVGRFTAGSDGGGLAFEQRSATDASKTAKTHYLSMMIFDLSNMRSIDYSFANLVQTTTLSDSTYANFATITIDNPQDDDVWQVWAWQASAMDNTTDSVQVRLQQTFGDSEEATSPEIIFEGEDLTEVLGYFISRPYTITDTPSGSTWTVQSRDSGTASTSQNEHLESTVFAIRLNAFRDFSSSYTDAETRSTSIGWIDLESSSFTPTHSGDVVVSAYSTYNPDGNTRKSLQRIQVDGTTSPNAEPESYYSANANDGTDELALGYITKYTGASGTAATIDYDVKYANIVEKGWKQFSLVVFTIDLASHSIIYESIASQIQASGDVAAEVNP